MPEYIAWYDAKRRCFDLENDRYKDYGSRGITMYAGWVDNFEAFLEHIGPRPKGHLLDRINNDGNYEPNNVKWVTPKESAKNRLRLSWYTTEELRREIERRGNAERKRVA
jgi:hypothetical protein